MSHDEALGNALFLCGPLKIISCSRQVIYVELNNTNYDPETHFHCVFPKDSGVLLFLCHFSKVPYPKQGMFVHHIIVCFCKR